MPEDREPRKAVPSTQRVRIQVLEAENARHLADLNQVRQERDTFRNEAAKLRKDSVKLRKEIAELRNKYDALVSTHEDVKRTNGATQEAEKPAKKIVRKRKAADVVDPDAMVVDEVPGGQPVKATTHKKAQTVTDPSERRKRTKLTAQQSTSQQTPTGMPGFTFTFSGAPGFV